MCKLYVDVEKSSTELSYAVRGSDSFPLENCILFYFFLLALHEREGMLSFSLINFILFLLVCYFYGILAQNFCFQLNKITSQLWHILLSLFGISKSWITL